jgi:ferrous iron transport protein B
MRDETVVALLGNPNSGKTTLFNALTGYRQHVGNWPGVTVEKKEGTLYLGSLRVRVVDLPGVYSLTAYSIDEIIARDFVVGQRPDVVINVVDASNLERNLYLTVQLLEMDAKVIVALNMMDVAKGKRYRIDVPLIFQRLGVPVVPIVAVRNEGIDELLNRIQESIRDDTPKERLKISYGKELDGEISNLEKVIRQNQELSQRYCAKWLAIKLLENDEKLISDLEGV